MDYCYSNYIDNALSLTGKITFVSIVVKLYFFLSNLLIIVIKLFCEIKFLSIRLVSIVIAR